MNYEFRWHRLLFFVKPIFNVSEMRQQKKAVMGDDGLLLHCLSGGTYSIYPSIRRELSH